MKAGLAAALVACREAAAPRPGRRRRRRRRGRRGAREPRRPGGRSRSVARRRRDRHRADRARARRRAQGLRLDRDRGDRPRRARIAARTSASTRSSKAGPILDRARRARRRPRRDGRIRCSAAARSTRRVIAGGEELSSYPARCVVGLERRTLPGRDGRGRRGRAASAARPLPRRRPGARRRASGRCSCASRSRSTADDELVGIVSDAASRGLGRRRRRSAARATGPTPRSSPPPASRRCSSGRPARARTPIEEWVSIADDRGRGPDARRARRARLRVSGARQRRPPSPARVPAPSERRARLPRGPARLRADPARSCRACHRARPRPVSSRTSPTGSDCPHSRSSAPRGRSSARSASDPDVARARRGERRQPRARRGPRGRAAGLACRIYLPARSAPARREAIAAEGAEVVVVDGDYEEAVAEPRPSGRRGRRRRIADVGDSRTAQRG